MKTIRHVIVLAFLSTIALAQTTHEVHLLIQGTEMGVEFYFEPAGLHVQPGDTVRFIADTPHHTVTAYHLQQGKPQRVPEGVEPFSSPVLPIGTSWDYSFTIEGTYDIWCAPHEMFGMAMRIVVGQPGGPAEQAITDFGPEGVFGASGSVLSDPALSSLNIMAMTRVSWADISPEAKMPPETSSGTQDHNMSGEAPNEIGARRAGAETDL